jgi:hypothetical protein
VPDELSTNAGRKLDSEEREGLRHLIDDAKRRKLAKGKAFEDPVQGRKASVGGVRGYLADLADELECGEISRGAALPARRQAEDAGRCRRLARALSPA